MFLCSDSACINCVWGGLRSPPHTLLFAAALAAPLSVVLQGILAGALWRCASGGRRVAVMSRVAAAYANSLRGGVRHLQGPWPRQGPHYTSVGITRRRGNSKEDNMFGGRGQYPCLHNQIPGLAKCACCIRLLPLDPCTRE